LSIFDLTPAKAEDNPTVIVCEIGDEVKFDGVVKTLHPESRRLAYLVRCYNFSIITTYRMYTEIIEKLHASNMKLFGVGVYALVLKGAYLLIHRN